MSSSDSGKKSKPARHTLTDTYRRIRKPIPPPEKVERDRRKKMLEEQQRREAEQELE